MLIFGSDSEEGLDLQTASTTGWNQFLRYVETKEGGSKTADGQYYIVEDDSAGNPTVGHGLCLKSYADNPSGVYLHVEEFKAYGIDSKQLADDYESGKTVTVSVETADAIWESHIKDKYDSVVSEYPDLTTYQHYALTDVYFRRGNIDGFKTEYDSKWTSSDDKYGNYVESNESFSTDTLYNFFWNGGHSKEGVNVRKKEQWVLFKYGYYRPLGEYFKAAPDAADTSSLNESDYKGVYKAEVSGYTFVEYYQNGASWSAQKLNGGSTDSSTIGNVGCHVVSMATALTAVTGETITPTQVNNAINFIDTDDTKILNTSEFSHLKSSVEISGKKESIITKEGLISELNAGNVVIIRFKGSSEWTSTSHYVVCADYKKENNIDYIYISNPYRNGPNGWISTDRITIATLAEARTISRK